MDNDFKVGMSALIAIVAIFAFAVVGASTVDAKAEDKPTDVIQGKVELPQGGLTNEEVDLIALVTMAEAEGESDLGKRYVIDTILNRVDSEHFPNTVHEVIYQKNQFSSMWNGRIDRCEVTDHIRFLVREEAENRTDKDVIFFTAGNYGKYGEPMFRIGNHYFSSYA
ncbi:MAG: cell wall hydrolase [Lachnospiraceae bacterium]|nr:cell wall hydrolase [Lachnospiraceae bacterium]